jgi:hypothetical protein
MRVRDHRLGPESLEKNDRERTDGVCEQTNGDEYR